MRRIITALMAAVLLAAAASAASARGAAQEISSKVLRLHILANSNGEADQAVKLAVRDAVIDALALSGAADLEEAVSAAKSRLPDVEAAVEAKLLSLGSAYGASAEVRESYFPVKEYGGYTLPAGRYTAVVVTLGSGEGRNWWCVMYPVVCYSGETPVDVTALGELLGDGRVEYRFKTAEILKGIAEFFDGSE